MQCAKYKLHICPQFAKRQFYSEFLQFFRSNQFKKHTGQYPEEKESSKFEQHNTSFRKSCQSRRAQRMGVLRLNLPNSVELGKARLDPYWFYCVAHLSPCRPQGKMPQAMVHIENRRSIYQPILCLCFRGRKLKCVVQLFVPRSVLLIALSDFHNFWNNSYSFALCPPLHVG